MKATLHDSYRSSLLPPYEAMRAFYYINVNGGYIAIFSFNKNSVLI